jgi:hypothetical protein
MGSSIICGCGEKHEKLKLEDVELRAVVYSRSMLSILFKLQIINFKEGGTANVQSKI